MTRSKSACACRQAGVAVPPLAVLILAAACGGERPAFALEPVSFDDRSIRVEWRPGPLADDPAEVRLYLADGAADSMLYETRIANGGAGLSWDNLRPVTDRPPELMLCINGAEQKDVAVRINARTRTVVAVERECTS